MIVLGLTVGLLQENCYILGCEESGRAAVIDPGDSPRAILRVIEERNLTLDKIINTHAHLDHVMAVDPIRRITGAKFYLHRDDLPTLHSVPQQARLWLDSEVDPIKDPDGFLEHGEVVRIGNEELEVRFTPGHSPGHVVFVHHSGRQVFAGDTLFLGSIGRYDLPGSDGPTLMDSIRTQLFSLPDDYAVHPGHFESTSIGHERATNPFVGEGVTDFPL